MLQPRVGQAARGPGAQLRRCSRRTAARSTGSEGAGQGEEKASGDVAETLKDLDSLLGIPPEQLADRREPPPPPAALPRPVSRGDRLRRSCGAHLPPPALLLHLCSGAMPPHTFGAPPPTYPARRSPSRPTCQRTGCGPSCPSRSCWPASRCSPSSCCPPSSSWTGCGSRWLCYAFVLKRGQHREPRSKRVVDTLSSQNPPPAQTSGPACRNGAQFNTMRLRCSL